MSGGITYDTVPGGGGRIFDGLKFWVAQRVPQRNTILEHIRNNSGSISVLEKDADYLIADHARKDAPGGSISWKFITESVQNGVVQIPDRYRIGHAPAGPRETNSLRPAKGTRAKFTPAEDAALAKWVLSHDGNENGNQIYIQFENIYPSHPWQSWRNRYTRKLVLLPRESLLNLAAQASDDMAPGAGEEAQDGELPDPTALMLQRKGERVQQQIAVQRAKKREQQAEPTSAQAAAEQQQDNDAEDTALTESKNEFYKDLQTYNELAGIEIAPVQEVVGVLVDLFELARAVSGQRLPAEEIDWLRVAEELGYTWLDMQAAVEALQSCYEQTLADFLETMEVAAEDDQPDDEAEPAEDQAAGSNNPTPAKSSLRSSPPPRFLPSKRRLDDADDDDGDLDVPLPAKRRRLNLPDEIPSTPEAQRRIQATPSTRRRPVAATPTRFETQVPNLQVRESTIDVTPSQQLHSEHLNSSPVPLRLNSAAQNRQVGGNNGSSSSAAKQPDTGAKRRVLPGSFKPQAAAIPEEEGSLFVPQDGGDDAEFPGALLSPQPPALPVGRPAQVVEARRRKSRDEELDELIQHYESLGYAHKTVIEGLRRTTMTPGLATVVMQSLQEGKGVPAHHEGIWTDRDDGLLRLLHSEGEGGLDHDPMDKEGAKRLRKARRARDKLVDKHGKERMALRIRFLNATDSVAAEAAQAAQAS